MFLYTHIKNIPKVNFFINKKKDLIFEEEKRTFLLLSDYLSMIPISNLFSKV